MRTQQDKQSPAGPGIDAQVDARRRKLVALGASSSLLLTIASRPAWAGGNICSPSALASANLSGQHSFTGCGISAGWWKSPKGKESWPLGLLSTQFVAVFGEVKLKNKSAILFDGFTMEEVIEMSGASDSNPGNIALHLVGAYLNALTFPPGNGPGYAFHAYQVVEMYNALNGQPKGHFEQLKNLLDDTNNEFDSTTAKP